MPDLAMLDYFYGDEAEQFTFYRIPKVLFTDPSYRRISSDAKILYGLMLDRMGLSVRNGWLDEYNRVFIFFTLEDALEYLCCGHTKAVSLFGELDKAGLIERKKQGQGKPTKIYVKNFVRNAEVLTSEKRKSKVPQSGSQDFQKTASNNTEIKDTELSDTEPSIHPARGLPEDKSPAADAMDTMRVYRQIIMENIEYDITRRQLGYDADILDEIVDIMVDTVCSTKPMIRIGGQDFPLEVVKSRLLKLNSEHPEKTDGGLLVTGYQCSPDTAWQEFAVSKQIYTATTGRKRAPDQDVISYLIIQSFEPGTITPEDANKLGYKLAMEFTGGEHQFIVATHVDKKHIHNHIEFNSTALDCSHKFNNVKNSFLPLRKANDRICQEFGLNIIEEPQEKGKHYVEWAAEKTGKSWKNLLRKNIDRILPTVKTFDEFLEAMRQEGYEVVQSKKILKFRAQGQERFTRSRILGADYTLEVLQERIGKTQLPRRKKKVNLQKDTRINLLMDIQARLQGRGPGMERWMKIHNLKEAAKTLNYLTEHGITEYDVLASRVETAAADFETVSISIKQMEHRMEQIAALKTHIINYAKTRNTYLAYRKTKAADKPAFRAAHETDLLLHEAAKRAFDALGVKKLPTVKVLQAEYTDLLAKKKAAYEDFKRLRQENQELQAVKSNVDSLLQIKQEEKKEQKQEKKQEQDR